MAIPGLDYAERAIAQAARDRNQDTDETRRLLYMAIVAPRCKRYNLAGTLINALRHHHGIDADDLEATVVSLVNGDDDLENWARGLIEKLSSNPPPPLVDPEKFKAQFGDPH